MRPNGLVVDQCERVGELGDPPRNFRRTALRADQSCGVGGKLVDGKHANSSSYRSSTKFESQRAKSLIVLMGIIYF
jgi:hypothetical protein